MLIKITKLFSPLIIISCSLITENYAVDEEEFTQKLQAKGGVASAHPLATKAGLEILESGGNVFDAAIAVASTLNVVEPMMSGIGGYGTILIYDAQKREIQFLNANGRFPQNTNTDCMREATENYMKNRNGPKSISTPGNLNAWWELYSKLGSMQNPQSTQKLPWNTLFKSAISHAENGFKMTPNAAAWLASSFDKFSEYSKSFYGRDGAPLKEGEVLIQTDLAKTFRLIADAKKGPEPLYEGEIAHLIDQQMREMGSFLSIADLRGGKTEWFKPIKLSYKEYDIYTAGLPANSFAAFVALALLSEFKLNELKHNSADYLHLHAEANKVSYKARLKDSRDPEIDPTPIEPVYSADKLRPIARSINMEKATSFTPPANEESRYTTHFVIVDQWGNIVSATQTLGDMFGSKVMIEGTGIWMNSSIGYSTFEPKGNPMDAIRGRHKLSGDCPIIIMKGESPWAALGTPGGHTITQNVPQIIVNLIDFKMDMQRAIDSPKIAFIEDNGGFIRAEKGIPEEVIGALKQKGHTVEDGTIGNATGIKFLRNSDNGPIQSFDVGIDGRRDGRHPIHNSSQ